MTINRATPQQYFGNMPQQQVQPAMQTQMQPQYYPQYTISQTEIDKNLLLVGLILGIVIIGVVGIIVATKK